MKLLNILPIEVIDGFKSTWGIQIDSDTYYDCYHGNKEIAAFSLIPEEHLGARVRVVETRLPNNTYALHVESYIHDSPKFYENISS